MPDRDIIQALRSTCLAALNGFVDQAHKTRQGFEDIEDVAALSNGQLTILLEQRMAENEALELYLKARRRLFAVAKNVSIEKPLMGSSNARANARATA